MPALEVAYTCPLSSNNVELMETEHPTRIQPVAHAPWRSDRMGKATLYESRQLLVGLNAFEPGQSHALHAHTGMDKVYHVLEGDGTLLLEGRPVVVQSYDHFAR